MDRNNELQEILLHYHAMPHGVTAFCEPFQKRVTGHFGDERIFPPMKLKQFKVEYSFFLKRQVSETLFRNFKCECTSGERPSNRHCGGRTHVLHG